MKRPPIPRRRIHKIYWSFASERQAAFERRVAGKPFPWTDDPILQEYKFCNVFRAADRVSQYMIRDVCYHEELCSPEDRIFQIVVFRTFSKIDTWIAVRNFLGRYPTLDDLIDEGFRKALDHAKQQNGGLYTGAFILCATNAYGQSLKHLNHVELFRHMFLQDAVGERILAASSLNQIYELLHGYPLMGDFMSYQIAIDLNYSDLIDFSENEFTKAGPGALRGISKVSRVSVITRPPTSSTGWSIIKRLRSGVSTSRSTAYGGDASTRSTARGCSARRTSTVVKQHPS